MSIRIWRTIYLFRTEYRKIHNIFSYNKKEVTKLIKKVKKSQNLYLTDDNLLKVQDLWQAHYQILLIILWNEFKKLNGNANTMIKNVKLEESNTKTVSAFLNIQTFKMI